MNEDTNRIRSKSVVYNSSRNIDKDKNIDDSNPLKIIRMNSLLDNEGSNSSSTSIDKENRRMDDNSENDLNVSSNRVDLIEKDTKNSNGNKFDFENRDSFTDRNNHHNEKDRKGPCQQLSNLSPSSMEVDFSNPHDADHSSFSRQQSAEITEREIIVDNTNTTMFGSSGRVNHLDDDEMEQNRDDYVKSGTHFRTLLDCAFRRVATGVAVDKEAKDHLFNEDVVRSRGDDDASMDNFNDDRTMSTTCGGKRELAQDSDDSLIRQRRKIDARERGGDDPRNHKLTSQFAREKMAEVLSLKRMVKEAEEHANALGVANSTLREASASSTARINTLTESIKITSAKVADARADADMAKAKASSLGTQLKSLKSALIETKRTCESIKSEHDDIQSTARSLEAKLVQTESELRHEEKEKFDIKLERDELRHNLEDQTEANKRISRNLEKKEDELTKLKKNIAERNDLERARIDRMNRLEKELRDVRSTLVDVSAAAKDAESTNVDLQNTIQTLQRENKSLHDRIEEIMSDSMREKSKLQGSLSEVESEAQKLRMKVATDEEDLKRSKLDLMSSEKEVGQLRSRISSLEARLKEVVPAAGVLSPSNESGMQRMSIDSPLTPATFSQSSSSNNHTNSEKKNYEDKENRRSRPNASTSEDSHLDMIPSLRPTTPKIGLHYSQSENKLTSNRNRLINKKPFGRLGGTPNSNLGSVKCCICFKAAYGIMKSCQCGNPTCKRRAHASCVAGKKPLPSVSHPGTPAPQIPCILCKGT